MLLAGMMKLDEDALLCDLAETYHIYDFKQLPISKVAVFACGLSHKSRIKMLLANQKVSLDELLLAKISDALNVLVWFKTEDGQKNQNRPPSIVESFIGAKTAEKESLGFATGKDYEEARRRLLGGGS